MLHRLGRVGGSVAGIGAQWRVDFRWFFGFACPLVFCILLVDRYAGVAQLVEHNVANVVVVGSNPITRFVGWGRAVWFAGLKPFLDS